MPENNDVINGTIIGANFHDERCDPGDMVLFIVVKQRPVRRQDCEIRFLSKEEHTSHLTGDTT